MRFPSALSGFWAALSPGLVLWSIGVIAPAYDTRTVHALPWLPEVAFYAGVAAALAAMGAAVAATHHALAARLLATLATATMVAVATPWLATSPLASFFALIVSVGLLSWTWDWLGEGVGKPSELSRIRGALGAAGLLWLGALVKGDSNDLVSLALATSQWVAAALLWRQTQAKTDALGQALRVAAVVAPVGLPLVLAEATLFALTLSFLVNVGAWFWLERTILQRDDSNHLAWLEAILVDPSRTLVVSFLFGGTVGGLLLALPIASRGADPVGLLDALFTAFSAICVTGLVVVDTPTAYSVFGQVILLSIIQVGGLGIMTFSTAALLLMGRRMSVKHELTAAALLQTQDRNQLRGLLKRVLTVTFAAEGVGAVLLAVGFYADGDTPAMALWRGLFTSISAFCNAGFALQSDSLVPYQNNPWVLHVTALIIIVGGLGPAVVFETLSWRPGRRISLQSRIVLAVTAVLLVIPAVLFLALEWQQTLRGMGAIDRVTNAWFQSVTMRTAGFNSVDLAAMVPASYSIMLILMFIGGSPGSTAGGAKTTTMAVLALQLRAVIRGERHPHVFGFRLADATVRQATAVSFVGFLAFVVTLFALQTTQDIGLKEIVYETISALGTVGLSVGATAMLDDVGKIVVMFAMFAGRVGPLTILMFLGQRADSRVGRPEAELDIG